MAEGSPYIASDETGALRQGEILSGLMQPKVKLDGLESYARATAFDMITHPFAIVVSQDCDLDWDFRARSDDPPSESKKIPSLLLCEVTTAESLSGRTDINSKLWQRIRINKDERYQFLERVPPERDSEQEGVPELGIDFKRYFTLPTEDIYFQIRTRQIKRRAVLTSPYVEHLSSRFCYFQSRIALPADHFSEPVA